MADAMNYIDRLVAELCPDGVDFYPIEELFTTRNGYTPSKSNSSYWENGTVPWFRMEDIRENGGVLSEAMQSVHESALKKGGMFPTGSIIVATSATIGEHALINVDFLCNQRFTVLTPKEEFKSLLLPKFLYYYSFVLDRWCLSNTTQSSFASVDMKRFKKFEFPVPPMEIQEAIVEILDKFTNLEAELEAELEARRGQYEYYRNHLLSYESLAARGPVEIVKLGDVAIRVVTGVTPQASNVRYYEGGANPWIRTQDVNFNRISVASEFVTDAAIDELPLKWVKANSVIVAISGASAGRSAILGIDAVTNQHCCNLEIDSKRADYRYVYYSIAARYNELRSLGRGARGDLNVSIIKSFEIPLPLVEQQSAVADLLDHFDALVNDISSGLPAEIAARRAQYEHYRDRLLSFSEKKAE